MKKFKVAKNTFFFLLIVFILVGVSSCKKKVEIEPINRIQGEIYCKVEKSLGSVSIDAGAEVEGDVSESGEKNVEVTSNLNFTIVGIGQQKWGCYGVGVYKGILIKAAVQADANSLKRLIQKYIDCGQYPLPATLTIYDVNKNRKYDKRADDTIVSYTLPTDCPEQEE